MLKIIFFSVVLFIGSFSFAQDSSHDFNYVFKFEGITEPSDAKHTIFEIRELLGVKVVRFNNETDEFTILTHLDWSIEEMGYDFGTIGLVLVGDLVKIIIE
ncbi:MAG: hypothetical protein GQ574_22295 [Crocinitomix sp.]|nr:hypothetical protein [Crocinitomix sp.]